MPDHPGRVVIALAGRRIDAANATERRFPAENVELVAGRIRALFQELRPSALVCSAANGADLLGLEVAHELAIERHIILPFPPEVFRGTSVADRGGDWAGRFDLLPQSLRKNDEIACLRDSGNREDAYAATNLEILKKACLLASQRNEAAQAVIVWNRVARGPNDNTQAFATSAREMGLTVSEISTL